MPGPYWVHHQGHRLQHIARTRLSRFPSCAKCDGEVRFQPMARPVETNAPFLCQDLDFKESAAAIPFRGAPGARGRVDV